jgi:hypothetical protein
MKYEDGNTMVVDAFAVRYGLPAYTEVVRALEALLHVAEYGPLTQAEKDGHEILGKLLQAYKKHRGDEE